MNPFVALFTALPMAVLCLIILTLVVPEIRHVKQIHALILQKLKKRMYNFQKLSVRVEIVYKIVVKVRHLLCGVDGRMSSEDGFLYFMSLVARDSPNGFCDDAQTSS